MTVAVTGRPPLAGRVSYLSPQPEFTPPVLYNRAKLVFLVEATCADATAARDLHPGQPADVAPPSRKSYGFLGPNGSGKTTSIRMLCGLLTPDAGTCLGYDVRTQQADIQRHVGYMTQQFSYYEDLSIRENLDFIARLYAVADRPAAVRTSLEPLGLTHRSHQLAGELSGGWKPRLALAACLIHSPQLLLLDEPSAGVDP